jgi:hypothetical protein
LAKGRPLLAVHIQIHRDSQLRNLGEGLSRDSWTTSAWAPRNQTNDRDIEPLRSEFPNQTGLRTKLREQPSQVGFKICRGNQVARPQEPAAGWVLTVGSPASNDWRAPPKGLSRIQAKLSCYGVRVQIVAVDAEDRSDHYLIVSDIAKCLARSWVDDVAGLIVDIDTSSAPADLMLGPFERPLRRLFVDA